MRNKLFLYALIFTGLIFSSTVYASNQHYEAFVDYDKDENLIEKAVYFNKGISVILNREINKETLNNAVIKKADGTSVNTYLSYDEASRNLTAVTDFDISADYVLDLSGITDSYNIPISEKVTANMKEKVKISGVRFYNEFSEDITSLGANESKKISAKYYAADAGEMSQSGNAILALYKDGVLTDVSIKEFSSYNALSEISVEKSRIENGYTAKLFFLDGFIEPLARAYTLPASLPEIEVEGKQLVSAEIELDNTEVIAKDLTPGKFSTSSGTVKDVFIIRLKIQ